MKILFLSHYFPPEVNAPASRTYEHCRIWAKENEVTVVTNFPNHPDGKIFPGYKNKLIQKEKVDGINVVRLWTFITPNAGFLLRIINFLVYMLLSISYIALSRKRYDVVISTTPQFFCGLAGKYAAKIKNIPFILELRDLWPESIIAVGALKNKSIIKFLERVELQLYKSADKIISVTKSFKENLVDRKIDPNKIEIIYNGVTPGRFQITEEISDTNISSFMREGFVVGYIGTLGMAHSIKTLVKAAEELKDTEVKFAVVGSGAERENLIQEIETKKLENIRIFPLQPKNQIAAIINQLSLFCVHLKKDPLFETVIPSKIFEGMYMKKPILMGVDGEARKIIEDADCGIFFEPENSKELVEVVNRYKNDPELMIRHGENGYSEVMNNFNREISAVKFIEIIEKIKKK